MKFITPKDLYEKFALGETSIIDVRSSDERSPCWIPGSVSIPYYLFSSGLPQKLELLINEMGREAFKSIVIYCGSESLAIMCASQFPSYMDVSVLAGGMGGWLSNGLPIEKE